jgi:hypothetical protein
MSQLSLFGIEPEPAPDHNATKLRILRRVGYTVQACYGNWPDGHVGFGGTLRCGDRVIGEYPNGSIVDAAWADYIAHGGVA